MVFSATTTGTASESHLFVTDRKTALRFLVNSGSVLSILPRKFIPDSSKQSLTLQAATGTYITTFCAHRLTLNLGLRRPLQWGLTIAAVNTAIAADFLKDSQLARWLA